MPARARSPRRWASWRPKASTVVAVDSSNAIAIRGDAATVAQLSQIAAELDRRAASGSEIRVVFLQHADAEQLLPVLQELLGQAPTPPSTRQRLRRGRTSNDPMRTACSRSEAVAGPRPGAGLRRRATATRRSHAQRRRHPLRGRQRDRDLGHARRAAHHRRGDPSARRPPPAGAGRGDHRRDFRHRRPSSSAFSSSSPACDGSEHPVRDHQLLERSRPASARIAGAIAARELGGTTTTITTGSGSTTTTTSGDGIGADRRGRGPAGADQRRPVRRRASRAGNAIFGTIINAVRSDNQSNILSTPSLMTLDNQEAHILVGQEIPITTGEALSAEFRQHLPHRPAPECRHHARGAAADQRRRHDQARPAAGSQLDRRAGLPQHRRSDPQQARDRERRSPSTTARSSASAACSTTMTGARCDRVPLLGDLPIIGNLFRSRGRSRGRGPI